MDIAHTAATIIARAREASCSTSDAFDLQIGIEGIAPYGELYQEAYSLANEGYPGVVTGDGEEKLAERKARADRLWEKVLPELNLYAQRCRRSRYTGWSRQSKGPVRRN
ncbi:hypothetical protein [Streptomyces sp. NPDC058280]|uniref:hypothetical protein n=1 Tax=Streptomyces sp. NPDC058280 TaxID=3346419 RepID=UPI0036F11918